MKKLICTITLLAATIISAAYCADKTMAEFNPEFEDTIIQALKPKNYPGWAHYTHEPKPCALFHFSDIHSDAEEFARLAEFYSTYEKYFDGAICTGDLVGASCVSDFTYWGKTKGHEKIMNIIGNHDTLRDHKNWVGTNWDDQISMGEAYERYMKPFIKGWNVIYEEGKTYYFKDYTDKRVRLIVIDCMLRQSQDAAAEDAQLKWFKECLTGAKVKGLHVVVACHFPLRDAKAVACNFTEIGLNEGAWYEELNKYQAAVDQFMKSGGSFVSWIGGHNHWDYICINPAFPDQYCVCVAAANRRQCEQYNNGFRVDGTKSMDLANAFIVDTSVECVKIIRIGADTDSYQQQRHGICFNYKTKEIISQY